MAVLKGDGFSCPKAAKLHDLLGHQFQFYTIKDTSLIDKMFACVVKKGISYTQCLNELVELVEGIDRLERKDENRVTWDSLKEGNEKPVVMMKHALGYLHGDVSVSHGFTPGHKAHTSQEAQRLIVAYSQVDALFTLSKLWQTARNRDSLLGKLGVRDYLNVEDEIDGYVECRNAFRHNPDLVCQGIETICEVLLNPRDLGSGVKPR